MDRQAQPDTHRSEQGVLNRSFDEQFQVLAVEMLAYNAASNTLDRTTSATTPLATRVDDTSTADIIYIGKAAAGAVTSAAVWQICQLDTSDGTVKTWADGNGNYDNIWDNRTSLSYL